MTAEKIVEIILGNTFTKLDALRRLVLVGDYLDRVQFGSQDRVADHAAAIAAQFPGDADAAAVAAWGNDALTFLASVDRTQIAAIRAAIEALPELVLYVPVVLNASGVSTIGGWCRSNVNPQVLLTIRVDPAVVGGCALVWQNAYWDFSLPYFINKHDAQLQELIGRTPVSRV